MTEPASPSGGIPMETALASVELAAARINAALGPCAHPDGSTPFQVIQVRYHDGHASAVNSQPVVDCGYEDFDTTDDTRGQVVDFTEAPEDEGESW